MWKAVIRKEDEKRFLHGMIELLLSKVTKGNYPTKTCSTIGNQGIGGFPWFMLSLNLSFLKPIVSVLRKLCASINADNATS